jgi:hypothetical protein
MSDIKYEYKGKSAACEWMDHAPHEAARIANEEQTEGWELVTFSVSEDRGAFLNKRRHGVLMVFRRLRTES